MIVFNLLFGLSIVGIGFFVKKYPDMISGYSTMSEEERENVDILSVASTLKKGMVIIGIVTMICPTVFSWLKLPELAVISIIAPPLIGILILTLLVQKYNHNKQSKFKKQLPALIVVTTIIIVSIMLFHGSRPTKVFISDNNIEFTGQYGLTVQTSEIEKTELLNNIPRIKLRTNGLGLGSIQKGHFILDEIGKCRLFLNLPNPPYLYIELKNGDKIIFNSTDSHYTEEVYEKIREL